MKIVDSFEGFVVTKTKRFYEEAENLPRNLMPWIISWMKELSLTYCGGRRYATSYFIKWLDNFLFFRCMLSSGINLLGISNVNLFVFVFHLQRMQMCRKPSTVQLVKRLDFSNLLGLDVNLKNGRWDPLPAQFIIILMKFFFFLHNKTNLYFPQYFTVNIWG